MIKKWIGVGVLVGAVLMGTACTRETKDENHMEGVVEQSQILVNDLTKARLDNRSMELVKDVFDRYEDRMTPEVWDEWFDLENPVVQSELAIVDKYGYVPVNYDIEKIYHGNTVSGGYTFTVVATIHALSEGDGSLKKDESVYFVYDFENEGDLIGFNFSNQDKEDVQ